MSDFKEETATVPLTVSVDLAAEILGIARVRAYAMAKSGDLPCLPGHGRKRVLVHRLETICARRLTSADIRAAETRLTPKREAMLTYQAGYRTKKRAPARAADTATTPTKKSPAPQHRTRRSPNGVSCNERSA